jgi:Flp pilus assembly protein TadG
MSARRKKGPLARLARDRRGASVVEFALIAPVLLLLLAGLIDGSQYIVQSMQVRAAAQAGAEYAQGHGFDADAITAAVQGATALPTTGANALAVSAPVEASQCLDRTGKLAAATGPTCPAGGPAGTFVAVNVSKPFTPILDWPGLAFSRIQAQSTVRVQ